MTTGGHMSQSTVRVNDPAQFRDPFRLDYQKYVRLQQRRTADFAEVVDNYGSADYRDSLDPVYLENQLIMTAGTFFGEYQSTFYTTRAASLQPIPALRECSMFQSLDELRHAQMDLWRMRSWGADWDYVDEVARDVFPNTAALFRWLNSLDDPFKIVFCGNFILETPGEALFPDRAQRCEANGDHAGFLIENSRVKDEVRHIGFAKTMTKFLLDQDPGHNEKVLLAWQDEFFDLLSESFGELEEQEDAIPVQPIPKEDTVLRGFQAYMDHLDAIQLRPPELLSALFGGEIDVPSVTAIA